MYKVFINDKTLCFTAQDLEDDDSIKLRATDHAIELVEFAISPQIPLNAKMLVQQDDPAAAFAAFTGSFPVIEAAGGLTRYLYPGGDVLMIFRLGSWDLPKGKIDKGESVASAALREVTEECGIGKLSITRSLQPTYHMYLHNNGWVVKKSHWFEMICSDTRPLKPQLEENITEARWVPLKEINDLIPYCYASIAELLRSELMGI